MNHKEQGAAVAKGALAYGVRYVFSFLLNFGVNIALIKLLAPVDFGYVAIFSVCVTTMTIFSEGGLNVYLVRKLGPVDVSQLGEFISFQVYVYLIIHAAATALLVVCYYLFSDQVFRSVLFPWVGMFALMPSLFRGVAFVALERRLEISRLAYIEFLEALVYGLLVLILAYFSFGVWSIVLATLVKSLAGFGLSFRDVPVGLRVHKPLRLSGELRSALKFGVLYHTPALLSQARAMGAPILIGSVLGLSSVGLCDRAAYIAAIPLMIAGAVQGRILFPYFSRIQDDSFRTGQAFKIALYVSGVVDKLLFSVFFVVVVPNIAIALGEKWVPAVHLMIIMAIGNLIFGALSSTISPLLNSHGHAGITARVAIVNTVFFWVFVYIALPFFGVLAFAYVSVLNWLSIFYILSVLYRVCPSIKIWASVFYPVLAMCLVILFFKLIPGLMEPIVSPLGLLIQALFVSIMFFVFLIIIDLKNVSELIRKVKDMKS